MVEASSTVFSRAQILQAMGVWERRHPTVDYCLAKEVSKLADVLATMDFEGEALVDLGLDAVRLGLVCEALDIPALVRQSQRIRTLND